ncbi:conjugative transposon protein TraM [Mucilaginibacter ginsenosidivorans]|uniref:Conjugative transposon protein TraM n=1 Tax=Mucilaginibacter ginsenosidivorans TaxID=398053 RepID=A0A5B8UVJ9_9SPHI|nr:conjugative transposon protein TraM [Mucilaginibacter ginsenosidivorans]QEC62466.1 conjugative transposon protein TraM [Mucilaginibacter ginsenosidivorans]
METITLQQLRRRKFLLVAPLVVLPFLTLLFWTLGGGKTSADAQPAAQAGFNVHLPDAKLKKNGDRSKLSYYDRAAADSEKYRQAAQTDPYARNRTDSSGRSPVAGELAFSPHPSGTLNLADGPGSDNPAATTAQINKKLTQLQALVNKAATVTAAGKPQPPTQAARAPVVAAAEDPELKQMNGLLEKILDIQHPERLDEKLAADVTPLKGAFQAIPAVVDGTQKLVQGRVVRIKLLDSVRLNGQLFPKGTLVYGSGDLYNQRVKINIRLIRLGLQIIPVDLSVYDRTDGLEGISVPEVVTGDAMKDGAVNDVQNMHVMSFDPSMTAQLTAAGINTAKGLFAKKIKRVKGKIKNGHQLLLRDNATLKGRTEKSNIH